VSLFPWKVTFAEPLRWGKVGKHLSPTGYSLMSYCPTWPCPGPWLPSLFLFHESCGISSHLLVEIHPEKGPPKQDQAPNWRHQSGPAAFHSSGVFIDISAHRAPGEQKEAFHVPLSPASHCPLCPTVLQGPRGCSPSLPPSRPAIVTSRATNGQWPLTDLPQKHRASQEKRDGSHHHSDLFTELRESTSLLSPWGSNTSSPSQRCK
jgi:hypothetical protein